MNLKLWFYAPIMIGSGLVGSTGHCQEVITLNASDPSGLQFETINVPIPSGPGGPYLVIPIDFNSDGNLDIVSARLAPSTYPETYVPLQALQNLGHGRFVDATASVLGDVRTVQVADLRSADLNGDGRMDLFLADSGTDMYPVPGGQSRLFMQTPDGRLLDQTRAGLPISQAFTHHICIGDVDGDGAPDFYLANIWSRTFVGPRLYVNDGQARFSAVTNTLPLEITTLANRYTACLFQDVRGNGVLDLVLGGHAGTEANDRILRNDGQGNFVYAPADALPARHGSSNWETIDIASGDIDGDGWPDLIMCEELNYSTPFLQLLLNHHDGTFRDASANIPQSWPASSWIQFVRLTDVNGDGYPDIVCTVSFGKPYVFLNDGQGHFNAANVLPPSLPPNLIAIVPGDFDGDGNMDLYLQGTSQGYLLHNLAPPRKTDYNPDKANQAIVFPDLSPRNSGDTVALVATASSGLPVEYGVVSGPGMIVASSLVLTNDGSVIVRAMQPGSGSYNPAESVEHTVIVAPRLPPVIKTSPIDLTVSAGAVATLKVTATGALPRSYQWQINGTDLIDNGRISGSQSNRLTIANVLGSDGGTYQVQVSNPYGSITSAVAVLTVAPARLNAAADARVLSFNPTGPDGTSPMLSVFTQPGNEQRSLLFFDLSSLGAGQSIVSATLKLYADTNFWSAGNPHGRSMEVYRLTQPWVESQVTWNQCDASRPWSAPGGDGVGTTGAAGVNPYAVSRTAVPDNYASPLLLSWEVTQLVQEWYTGLQTNDGLLLRSYQDNGLHLRARESGANGPVLEVTVAPRSLPPTITNPPQSQTVTAGASVGLNVSATGTEPLGYQWQFNGTNLVDDGRIAGSQGTGLTIPKVWASDSGNYQAVVSNGYGSITTAVATLTVLKATPVVTWADPGAITYGTALGLGQLNAAASVPGNLAYSPAAGTVLNVGSNALSVVFTPDAMADYNSVNASVNVEVLPASLVVAASQLTRRYGAADPVFTGELMGLANGDVITANYSCAATLTSPPGDYAIVPSLVDPDNRLSNYTFVVQDGALTILPAPLIVTTDNAARVYGQSNPIFAGTMTGLVNSDNIKANFDCLAAPTSPPGDYAIVPSLMDPDNRLSNYQVTLINGTLTVTPADPPIIAAITPNTGPTNGDTTVTILGVGFESGATVNFGASPALSVKVIDPGNVIAVTPPAGPGAVDVVVTNADGQTVTLTNGFVYTLPPVWPPAIVGQPTNQVVGLGASASFAVTATGTAPLSYQWQFNGTDITDNGPITGSHNNSLTIANAFGRNAGSYQAVITNAYGSATSAVATLTVLRATPVVTWANPAAITYGTALGLGQLNAAASVPGSLAYSPAVGTVLDAGSNALSVVFTPDDPADYDSVSAGVNASVLPASLVVTASKLTRQYGAADPVFAGTITGLVNSDHLTATYSCLAAPTSPPGDYPIVPSLVDPDNRLSNYQVTLINGTLTVTPAAPPIITAITPNNGPTNGDTSVTILGAGFESGATVNFGTSPALSVKVLNSTNITAVTPPSGPGAVDVGVTNADGQTVTLTNGFVYLIVGPPVFQTVIQADDMITFTWNATAGRMYQVERKLDLNDSNWSNLVTVIAINSTATASDAVGPEQHRFYRVVLLP